MDLKLPESSGLIIMGVDAIPLGNPAHGGEMAVCLKRTRGMSAWGFGLTYRSTLTHRFT